jgi:hypothetical protein
MLELLELRDVGPAPLMRFELAPRLNLLTGDNSLGKSFVLDCLWWLLTQRWAKQMALPTRLGPEVKPAVVGRWHEPDKKATERHWLFDRSAWRWKLALPLPKADLRLYEETAYARAPALYVRMDGEFSVWDPLRNIQDVSVGSATSFERPVPLDLSASQVWDGRTVPAHALLPEGSQRWACNGLLRDWQTWRYQKKEVFEQFRRVLEGLSPHPERESLRPGEAVRISPEESRDIPVLVLPYGEVPITLASAGLRRVLSLAYLLVWMWYEHIEAAKLADVAPARELVVLVDEIEAHLHPQWQRVILPALFKVLRGLEPSWAVQVVATTHAPLVLASAEPLFEEPHDALFHFALHEGTVQVHRQPLVRQGDVVGWLTSEVFGLEQARSRDAEDAVEAAEAFMRGEVAALPEGLATREAIHAELQRLLPGHDPFWARWIVSTQESPSP